MQHALPRILTSKCGSIPSATLTVLQSCCEHGNNEESMTRRHSDAFVRISLYLLSDELSQERARQCSRAEIHTPETDIKPDTRSIPLYV